MTDQPLPPSDDAKTPHSPPDGPANTSQWDAPHLPNHWNSWEDIANDWLADPKSDSSMLDTCYYALRTSNPELAGRCRILANMRRKSFKH